MNEDSLFSETEEELFNKIKKLYDNINKDLNEAGIRDDSFLAFSIDDTISLSDNGLSQVSDISSVASFKFSNVNKIRNEFQTPQIDKQKNRKSKIPIFDQQRKNRQNMTPNSNNSKNHKNNHSNIKNFDKANASQKSNQLNTKRKNNPRLIGKNATINNSNTKKTNQTFNYHNQCNNNQINIYNYQEPIKPKNFLVPDLSIYSRICVCIFEGCDFPKPSAGRGERSTYAVIQLHPDMLPIQSPISFNKTKQARYNGGFDINCNGFDFTSVTPNVTVYDYISEKERELIGVAFIELHLAKKFNSEMCIFMLDEWLDIFALNNHVKTGRVKITLIFHTEEKDVSSFIKKKSIQQPNIHSKNNSNERDDEDKFIMKNEIIIKNEEEEDISFIMDDEESIKNANEKLKNDQRLKRNQNNIMAQRETKFESLGIQAEPEFQNEFMHDFQALLLNSSSSSPINDNKDKNPFNFNINYNKNIKDDHINNNNQNYNSKKLSTITTNNYNKNSPFNYNSNYHYNNQNQNIYETHNDALNSVGDDCHNINIINNFESDDDNYDDNKFNFTLGHPSFENDEVDINKEKKNIFLNGDSIIESDSLIIQKVPLSSNKNNTIKALDEKHLKFIDESMLATMSSLLSNEDINEQSLSLEEETITNQNNSYEKEKASKRYTSYSDFHFMEEMK